MLNARFALVLALAGCLFTATAVHADSSPVAASDWSEKEPTLLAAADAPAVEEAAPAEESAEVLTPADDKQLKTGIDLDKIKLERLYQAIESKDVRSEEHLSLEDCVGRALQENQDIRLLTFNPLKSTADVLAARGEFDPVLSGNYSYSEIEQSASAQAQLYGGITSISANQMSSQAALAGKLYLGTQYTLSLDMGEEEVSYNDFAEEWSGSLSFSLTQPLLRGRGRAANMARILQAKNSRITAESQLSIQVMTSLADVIKAYWDLVGAVDQLEVRKKSMENAENLLDVNQKRFEIGTGAAIEVVQAQAGLASRQSELISARAQIVDAEDRLKNLLNIQETHPLYLARLIPTDKPSPEDIDLNEAESIAIALKNRPEILSAEVTIDNAKVEERRSGNDLLPQLDITGTITQGGRDDNKKDVFDGIRERQDNSQTLGFQGSIPIGNRAARGQFQRARLDRREAELRMDKTKQDIALNIRLANRAVDTNRVLVESGGQTRALQEINLKAEEKRLELGVTTSYQVLDVEEDLTAAKSQEAQAMVNFEKALVDLRLAEGTLLTGLGIDFAQPEAQKPVKFLRSVVPPRPFRKESRKKKKADEEEAEPVEE